MAIGESPDKKLKLCQIYDWIRDKFPYYQVSHPPSTPTQNLNLKPCTLSLSQTVYSCRASTPKAGRTPSATICHSMNASSRYQVRGVQRGRETTGCLVSGFWKFIGFNLYFPPAQGYDDMFESGNFKRRKRMRRHSYKPGLYKAWLGESQAFQSLYRSYPSSLYMSGAPWSSLPSVKTEIGGYGYGGAPTPSALSSYTSSLQSPLSHLPSPSTTYHQYGEVPQLGTSSPSAASFSSFPPSGYLRLNDTNVTLANDDRIYNKYNPY